MTLTYSSRFIFSVTMHRCRSTERVHMFQERNCGPNTPLEGVTASPEGHAHSPLLSPPPSYHYLAGSRVSLADANPPVYVSVDDVTSCNVAARHADLSSYPLRAVASVTPTPCTQIPSDAVISPTDFTRLTTRRRSSSPWAWFACLDTSNGTRRRYATTARTGTCMTMAGVLVVLISIVVQIIVDRLDPMPRFYCEYSSLLVTEYFSYWVI